MSELDFGLSGLELTKDTTAVYTLYALEGDPSLVVATALETNKNYYNAVLRKAKKNLRRIRSGTVSAEQLREQRDDDRVLFAKHVVKGWNNLVDSKHKPVPFSEKNALSFLKQLPDWIFDEVRSWCGDANNFLAEDDMTEEEVEETGEL